MYTTRHYNGTAGYAFLDLLKPIQQATINYPNLVRTRPDLTHISLVGTLHDQSYGCLRFGCSINYSLHYTTSLGNGYQCFLLSCKPWFLELFTCCENATSGIYGLRRQFDDNVLYISILSTSNSLLYEIFGFSVIHITIPSVFYPLLRDLLHFILLNITGTIFV